MYDPDNNDALAQLLIDDKIRGKSYLEISQKHGIPVDEVISILREVYAATQIKDPNEYRALLQLRLEKIIDKLWDGLESGSFKHGEAIVKSVQQLQELHDLNEKTIIHEFTIISDAETEKILAVLKYSNNRLGDTASLIEDGEHTVRTVSTVEAVDVRVSGLLALTDKAVLGASVVNVRSQPLVTESDTAPKVSSGVESTNFLPQLSVYLLVRGGCGLHHPIVPCARPPCSSNGADERLTDGVARLDSSTLVERYRAQNLLLLAQEHSAQNVLCPCDGIIAIDLRARLSLEALGGGSQ